MHTEFSIPDSLTLHRLSLRTLQTLNNNINNGTGLGNTSLPHSGKAMSYLTHSSKTTINKVAIATSSLSVFTSAIAFYYFIRMEKRYRHRLIMVNITGDLLRAVWFFISSAVSLSNHQPSEKSALCQMTGYFLSMGHELTDFSVLFITIHGAIQIYRPTVDIHDPSYGLNPYRVWVNSFLAIIPIIFASLAFINPSGGYTTGGSVCWLPIRPFWYRLALSWIPRYIVFVAIISISACVYYHVGKEFKSFKQVWILPIKTTPEIKEQAPAREYFEKPTASRHLSAMSSVAPDVITSTPVLESQPDGHRRSSLPEIAYAPQSPSRMYHSTRRHTANPDQISVPIGQSAHLKEDKIKGLNFLPRSKILADTAEALRRESIVTNSTISTKLSTATAPVQQQRSSFRLPSNPFKNGSIDWSGRKSLSADADLERNISEVTAIQLLEAKRQTIMFQLRMNFVYPIIYMVLWIAPFILHCMQYKTKYAMNAPPALATLATVCISSMGFANSIVFLLREKPWRLVEPTGWSIKHVPCCGKPASENEEPDLPSKRTSKRISEASHVALAPESNREGRRRSSTSTTGSKVFAAFRPPKTQKPVKQLHAGFSPRGRARMRLAFERADRRAARYSADSTEVPQGYVGPVVTKDGVAAERNWWDAVNDGDDGYAESPLGEIHAEASSHPHEERSK
ncbi:hypothetical protein BT63DRAFT_182770 [Microthyrium microscopicum]|uniref:Family A G protein-coupled receptor-like protein n=1 Tax=Microthyrium microscopicum TaxID=703497 RepID=A0A6A6UK29_9PEZI|nr:hypothetical protein BT63DRAFT_182770 [Microthyrium microscopicum]